MENFFTIESKLKVLSLKNMLQILKKRGMTIHECFRKLKDVTDALIANSQNVIKGELINLHTIWY